MTKEFKKEWRLRSVEERKVKIIDWCKFGSEQDQERHQLRLSNTRLCKKKEEYVKDLWKSWEAWGYTVNTPEYMNDATYRGRFPWDRRDYISKWYEGIHQVGSSFSIKKQVIQEKRNRGFSGPCEDGYVYQRFRL